MRAQEPPVTRRTTLPEDDRRFAPLAWGLAFLCFVLAGVSIALARLNNTSLETMLENSFGLVFATVFPLTGAIVASRRPGNAIGWLMIGGPLFAAVLIVANAYANRALLIAPGLLPGGGLASWVVAWGWIPMIAMFPLLLLLFPHGRPLSRRWRWVLYIFVADATFSVLGFMALWPFRGVELLREFNEGGLPAPLPVITKAAIYSFPLFVAATGAGIVSLLLRFRRSRAEERQQLKWFTYAATIAGLEFLASLVGVEVNQVWDTIAIVVLAAAIAIAILKYRLYEIDRIINRTIVYALVTASAVAVYAAIVFLAGTVAVRPSDNLTVAAATLAAAAIFRPLLRRVQRLVDRRFYRQKYDAQQTIDAFGARLREETDIDALTDDLLSVVRATMHPSPVNVWLRPTESSGGPVSPS
jgi:MFS family permease